MLSTPLQGRFDPPESWGYYLAPTPYIGGSAPYLTPLMTILKHHMSQLVCQWLHISEWQKTGIRE